MPDFDLGHVPVGFVDTDHTISICQQIRPITVSIPRAERSKQRLTGEADYL